ncbi:MAG: hypothetical protein P8I00_04530 [Methylophilaceae bacterium]|nr:hypothetical protein [Methylophilaceae bacterium]
MTDPIEEEGSNQETELSTQTENEIIKEVNLFFVRPADPLTIGQDVELYVDDDEIGELTYNTKIQTTVKKPGTYELATKVGWSFSAPVTGLGGACKYEGDFKFTEKNYYFKIVFEPGLLCGEHEIIGILESEYSDLAADID